MPPAPLRLSAQAERTTDQPISYFMKAALETPGLISLAAGLVDEPSLPVAEVRDGLAELLADDAAARAALQYGTTLGYRPLRQKLLDRLLAADGVTADALNLSVEDVVITNGSQQFLYLLAEVLLDPGDIVFTEAPSYFVYHSGLTSHGARVIGIPTDDHGMRIDVLERELTRLDRAGELGRVKMVYAIDYFQNPTGRTLSVERRRPLVELVRKYSRDHRIILLEDAAYREMRFAGHDIPSLKSLDSGNEFVAYTSTFSKPCSPGVRIGYGILPADLMTPVHRTKGNHDFGSPNLMQHLADRLLASGAYDRHLADVRAAYRAKRDAMLDALTAAFREWPGVRFEVPEGGMYFWLQFPETVPTGPGSPLMEACLKEGVLYVPGSFCHVIDEHGRLPGSEARLCYGVATSDEIREGVRRLAKAAYRLLDRPSKPRPAVAAEV